MVFADEGVWEDGFDGGETDGVVGGGEGVEVDEDEAADVGGAGDLEDGGDVAMAGLGGAVGAVVGEVAFVDEEVDAADSVDVGGVEASGGVGDVGHRVAGPIESEAGGSAAMFEGEVSQSAAAGEGEGVVERLDVEGGPDREEALREEMFDDGLDVFGEAVEGDAAEGMDFADTEEEGQSDDVIDVGVADEDIEFGGCEELGGAIDTGARIEHDAALGQQEAEGVPPLVGMVSGGAEKD